MACGDLPFEFPPATYDQWCELSDGERQSWLRAASGRFFSPAFEASTELGRVVRIRGELIDSLPGFYCAIGEAVNGPGGYFGAWMHSFDDCLFGKFGLEFPYTIVFEDSEHMRSALGPAALLRYLDDEVSQEQLAEDGFDEARAWYERTRAAALAGTRTMLDEIIEGIRSVPRRVLWRADAEVTLLLE